MKKGADPEIPIYTSPQRDTPIVHGALYEWNVDELNADGTRKFAAGEYLVKLTVTPGKCMASPGRNQAATATDAKTYWGSDSLGASNVNKNETSLLSDHNYSVDNIVCE